jgi:outer membrane protein assembly factor BamD (BamD/ComL family)
MKKFFILLMVLSPLCSLEAGYSPYLQKWTGGRYAPQYSAHEHYDLGYQLFLKKEWGGALPHFFSIIHHFEDSDFYADALYCAAVCRYFQGELDLANKYFSDYLSAAGNLRHYEKALEFKFHIAEYYASGRKKHFLARKFLPTTLGTLDETIRIYDEVIAALSNKELAVRALYGKASILHRQKKYDESVEVLKTLTHRYEVHELSEQAFLKISEIYLERAYREAQNPDLIALAELNVRSFHDHFPSSPKIKEVEDNLSRMQELFAESLFKTAEFYVRKAKPMAAQIYLKELVARYPNTESAQRGRDKIQK